LIIILESTTPSRAVPSCPPAYPFVELLRRDEAELQRGVAQRQARYALSEICADFS